jgi:hypothetical protein
VRDRSGKSVGRRQGGGGGGGSVSGMSTSSDGQGRARDTVEGTQSRHALSASARAGMKMELTYRTDLRP